MKDYKIWKFTFVNKLSLDKSPVFLCLGCSLKNAENRMRKYFPKNLWDIDSVMVINNKDLVIVPMYTNLEILSK